MNLPIHLLPALIPKDGEKAARKIAAAPDVFPYLEGLPIKVVEGAANDPYRPPRRPRGDALRHGAVPGGKLACPQLFTQFLNIGAGENRQGRPAAIPFRQAQRRRDPCLRIEPRRPQSRPPERKVRPGVIHQRLHLRPADLGQLFRGHELALLQLMNDREQRGGRRLRDRRP